MVNPQVEILKHTNKVISMVQLEKSSGIAQLRDFDLITYFDTSCERR